MDFLNELNKEQLEAVFEIERPVLILAGAGSGKTRVITYKIAYLIKNNFAKPENIVALTFTNKAAEEMKRRIDNLLGVKNVDKVWAGTFHGFGLYLLKNFGRYWNLCPNFVIYDENDQEDLIKDILKDLNRSKEYSARDIKEKISRLKDQLITPQEFSNIISNSFDEIVLEVYKKYEKELRKNNALDFADLLLYSINLLYEKPAICGFLQDKIEYVLVDEYQDTNKAQYELFKIIVLDKQKFSVVGDDDQSIYSFRGADYQNIFKLEKDFKNLKIIFLTKNYRSTQQILEIANALIANNDKRYPKELWSDKRDGTYPILFRALNEEDEANFVIRQIRLELAKGRKLSEIAILYRTNRQSRPFEEALIRNNIPYKVIGGLSFFDRKEVKDIVAYLNIIYNPNDLISLKRIINVPKRGIGEATFNMIREYYNKGYSLLEAIGEVSRIKREVKSFYDLWKYFLDLKSSLNIRELIATIIDKTNYLSEFQNQGKEELTIRMDNLMELMDFADNFPGKTQDTLGDFLSHLSLTSSKLESSLEEGKVSLITLHSVKGLEFEVVFLVGMEEGLLPHYNAATREEIQEERRLCYVGITRAKEKLYLSYAVKRYNRYQEPSRFIEEISHLLSVKK
ncbi:MULTISPECIES: ATP-dependent helicase [Dictyoglomus]|uniref:DNA 3'-5' helicase n=1 Tax=Dictyoglomus turgidum (strain DSM 6724 / Z-1310) TaxID=515635 RepID=B8E0T4_DICTD|nr:MULTISPECIES: UvrD-helicase domain-containing protein [Dictyoglomus]ACK42671.1 UvrD/REP helicase [Dictyoglomus turgidum DSM 6724]HBU30730.1 ATP-dependent DNA helicase PcrA [Dictyoglomus sp.]